MDFENWKENDFTTKIDYMVMLKRNDFKTYVVVPILGICTAFFFLLCLWWFTNLRKIFFYDEVKDIR